MVLCGLRYKTIAGVKTADSNCGLNWLISVGTKNDDKNIWLFVENKNVGQNLFVSTMK